MTKIKVNTLRDQLTLAHQILEDTIKGVSAEHAHWQPASNAHSVAANYAHVIVQEDVIISALLKGEKPLFATQYAEMTGLSQLPPLPTTQLVNWQAWGQHLEVDLAAAQAYSQSVYANTHTYLESISDEDLGQTINTGFLGEMTKFELLNLTVLTNCNWHTGEISAVKGLQGLQGYPF